MMLKSALAGAACLTTGLACASAATLVTDAEGMLLGARNVTVDGVNYDVDLVSGACDVAYDGCASDDDLAFQTEAGALAAIRALMEQVFIDGPAGDFDTDFAATAGCEGTVPRCSIFVPYDIDEDSGDVTVSIFENRTTEAGDAVLMAFVFSPDFFGEGYDIYARFSAAADPEVVPVPAAALLFGPVLLGGIAVRRRLRGAEAS